MRSFTTLLCAASLLAGSAFAAPSGVSEEQEASKGSIWSRWLKPRTFPPFVPCLTAINAQIVANNFRQSIAAYTDALALSAFTPGFTDYSDSVIELIDNGCPNHPVALGSPTFTSRAAFMAGQKSQPPIPFQILNVWNNCNTVIIRWKSYGPGQTPSQVTGIIVIETTWTFNTFLINKVYSEFNSGAWLSNLGIFKPTNCSA